MKKDLTELQQKLKITFKDISQLEQSLTHSSFINENPGLNSNERLEFLGDALLGLVIGEKLYRDFPEYAEGELTRFRAALVKRETLTRVANDINLGNYLYLGKGEAGGNGRTKAANLAGAMESVIAAVYIDVGFKAAEKLILRLFKSEIEAIVKRGEAIDYKSQLQALMQSKYHNTPDYSTIEAEGPDHARKFTVEAKMGKKVLGKGSGHSKQIAEMEAARLALEQLRDFTQ
jgi:ribonuclease-3